MESFPQEWKEKQVLQGWQLLNHDMLPSGEGGYGKVYKIAKEDTGETAALKWIRIKTDSKQQMSEAHRRLSTEIKVMYDMSSVPQIVHIQDYAIMDNEDELCVDALIRMEWLQPLKERIRKLKLQDVAQIATDISEALKQLHAKNLVHEDVKLENILYGDGIYKLSDFGCASYLSSSVVGRPGGTSFYRAPEYLQKEAVPSFVGDIYSLGMTFYLLFNDGKLPYQKTGISTTAAYEEMKRACAKGAGHYPPPADAVAPIADVIAKATAIQPEARYQRVEDFKRELCQAIAQLPLKTPLHEDGDRGTQSASSHKPRRPFSSSNHQAQSVYQTSQTAAVRTAEHTKRTQDGFQIPQNEAEAPAAQEEKPEEVPESKRRGHLVRWVLAIAAVMLVAGMMVLLRLVHQENITVAAANCTNVILQAKEEKQAQIRYYALGTPNHAVEQSISRWPVGADGADSGDDLRGGNQHGIRHIHPALHDEGGGEQPQRNAAVSGAVRCQQGGNRPEAGAGHDAQRNAAERCLSAGGYAVENPAAQRLDGVSGRGIPAVRGISAFRIGTGGKHHDGRHPPHREGRGVRGSERRRLHFAESAD